MSRAPGHPVSRACVHVLVTAAGLAALSWEVMWQIKSSLALGVSAWGTALTLAITMGGMSLGSLAMSRALRHRAPARPVRLYGVMEILIGVVGLFFAAAFRVVERLDTLTYAEKPGSATLVHVLGIVAVLGIPTMCMGATLPVFGLVARQFRTSIAVLYGLNTLGAAAGALLAAFGLIPLFGVTHTAWIIAAVNIAVGILTWTLGPGEPVSVERPEETKSRPQLGPTAEQMTVLVTGFATFALEVAWFRSLTAAFHSTTDSFAIMLAAVLIALGVAARLVPMLKRKNVSLGSLVSWAGILILVATPVVERFEFFTPFNGRLDLPPAVVILNRFIMALYVIGPPVLFLGMAVPWILDDQHTPRRWGMLYALNTLAAIAGSIGAAWLLLPAIGFARTAWLAGGLAAVTGILTAPRPRRVAWTAFGIAALLVAVTCESGVGRTRAQGQAFYAYGKPAELLEFYEGPEATISVARYENGGLRLIIDGSSATGQSAPGEPLPPEHYMAWMGHLPMLLHPDPKNALVICFGTGQTANAVRQENPESLDIVDINPRVFRLAHNFTANQGVLDDPRVRAIVMDGRAYMRRTRKMYDVITLEPMPPVLAGVNALYSREFYEFARARLGPRGVIAQWLPFHAVSIPSAVAIAKTFQDVFPNAILWTDAVSQNGILLGTKDDDGALGTDWPGFARTRITRDLSEEEVRKAVLLDRKQLKYYGEHGQVVSDDNQLLAYGSAVYSILQQSFQKRTDENLAFIDRMKKDIHD